MWRWDLIAKGTHFFLIGLLLFSSNAASAEGRRASTPQLRPAQFKITSELPYQLDLLTPLGRDRIVLSATSPTSFRGARTAREGMPAIDNALHADLWRAKAVLTPRGGPSRRGVAIDRIGNRLRIILPKRRYGGFFVVSVDLTTSKVRMTRIPGSAEVACGKLPASRSQRSLPAVAAAESSASTTAIFQPIRQLEVGLDADGAFSSFYGSATLAEMEAILNAAAAIYLDQLGIRITLASTNIFSTSSNPYTSRSSNGLLDEFRAYTLTNRHLGNADLFHLFTGVNLEDNTVGLGFVGVACIDDSDFGFGLSQRTNSAVHFLITAHELGHNLGANHPEERLNPDPRVSLMSGVVTASHTTFSDFSRKEIVSFVRRAGSCIAAEEIPVQLSVSRRGTKYKLSFTPRQLPSTNCRVTVYGSSSQANLQRSLLGGSALGSLGISPDVASVINASQGSNQSNFYVRGVLRCDDGQASPTSIKKLRGGSKIKSAIKRALLGS